MTNNIKHIIWDWNGTLVNDAWLFVELMNEELSQRNLPLIDIQKYRQNFTFPVKKYYENLGFDFKKESFQEVGYNFIQKYKHRKHEPALFDETIEILTGISERGISQSIISAQENTLLQESIQHYNITEFFDSIIGIEHYYADSKIKIAQNNKTQLNCSEDNILMIGDTIHDNEVAESLNISCILFTNGHYSRRRLQKTGCIMIDSLLEINNYLKGVE